MQGRFVLNYSLNFASAILLIYASKFFFRQYPVSGMTLTISNCFISSFLSFIILRCIPKTPVVTPASPIRSRSFSRMLLIAGSFSSFITFSNLSLQYNSLGTYQLIKLQVPPLLMLVEYMHLRLGLNSPTLTEEKFRRDYSAPVLAAFAIIVFGTLVNTYTDLRFQPWGVLFACISVICNALYQASVQGEQVTSTYDRIYFLQVQTFVSAIILVPVWPFIDATFAYNPALFRHWDAVGMLVLCGLLGFLVNTSVVWCIKDDAAIGFNMVGQLKTLLIIFLGSVLFREALSIPQVISVLLTTVGCVIYVYITYRTKADQAKHQLGSTSL